MSNRLVRLEKKAGEECEGDLGYDWIEILSVTPGRILKESPESMRPLPPAYDEAYTVEHVFLCKTDDGLHLIPETDIYLSIEIGDYEVVA